MTETIFKPGAEYRTRDGRRARVYATDGATGEEIHGAIYATIGWIAENWTRLGKYFGDGARSESGYDLMPPEPNPATVTVTIRFSDGKQMHQHEFELPADCIRWPND